jgi:hypothetical protein
MCIPDFWCGVGAAILVEIGASIIWCIIESIGKK